MSSIEGVVVGLVTDVDKTISGRVKVHFTAHEASHQTDWIRIATAMAGKDRGTFFMPEVNDEVLVAFERGDVRFPYVVGFLWNGVDKAPDPNPKNRVIVTPGKHTLRFEDGDNAKKIIIRSSSGHEIILDDAPAGQSITLKTKGNQTVILDGKGNSIELRGGGRILALRGGQVQIT